MYAGRLEALLMLSFHKNFCLAKRVSFTDSSIHRVHFLTVYFS